jgi:hypothetical protein
MMMKKSRRALLFAAAPLMGLSFVGCTVYETAPPDTVAVVQNPAPAPAPPPPPPAAGDPVEVVPADAPPPPPAVVEVQPVVPYPGAVWVTGRYVWHARGWVWVGGYYHRPPYVGAVYVHGYYHHSPRGYVWVGGYWR